MPCPHNEITIVQRSQRQSAVAAAAYQSGEKLFCEYDQQVKLYAEYRKTKADMQEVTTIKANIDYLLGYSEPGRKKEQER